MGLVENRSGAAQEVAPGQPSSIDHTDDADIIESLDGVIAFLREFNKLASAYDTLVGLVDASRTNFPDLDWANDNQTKFGMETVSKFEKGCSDERKNLSTVLKRGKRTLLNSVNWPPNIPAEPERSSELHIKLNEIRNLMAQPVGEPLSEFKGFSRLIRNGVQTGLCTYWDLIEQTSRRDGDALSVTKYQPTEKDINGIPQMVQEDLDSWGEKFSEILGEWKQHDPTGGPNVPMGDNGEE